MYSLRVALLTSFASQECILHSRETFSPLFVSRGCCLALISDILKSYSTSAWWPASHSREAYLPLSVFGEWQVTLLGNVCPHFCYRRNCGWETWKTEFMIFIIWRASLKWTAFVKFGVSYWKLDAINFIAIGVNNLFWASQGKETEISVS